ncbi:zinc finger protein [Aphelenchoides avenae]|nr:zinc finger protein [Aphelenchus avenae]
MKYSHKLKMHLHKYNHRRAPGTVMSEGDANATDHFEDPSENGTSMELQQVAQQFRADPSVLSDDSHSLSAPETSVQILEPKVTSAPMPLQCAMPTLRQQHVQMAHVQQAIASNNNANLIGYPTLASLLANPSLQNRGPLLPYLMQQLRPLVQTNTLNSAALHQVNPLQLARHNASNENSSSPTGSKMSVAKSGSPDSDIAPAGSSRKRKAQYNNPKKPKDIEKRGRGDKSPNSDEHLLSANNGHSERQSSSSTMHMCKHCDVAFPDQALYHIHVGYHTFENPYKCNRCGQVSDNSRQFYLHLYQERHDML